jgi:methyl-accepting chemotaxis protein
MALMNYFTVQNSAALALESVNVSQKLFTILEAREISKMSAVSDALIVNPQIQDALAAKDRNRLLAATAPLYSALKIEGITNWMFHTPEPDMSVFLRLHNPAKFGDHLNRFLDKEVVRTHAIVTGNELARAGFAVRIIRPINDSKGKAAGYVELGEEMGQFIHALKSQTGNEYGLLLSKKSVDRQFWADSSAVLKRRDNWDDNANFVVADKTTDNDRIIRFDSDLATIPAQGKVLEQFNDGKSVLVRGIFPIRDAAGNTVGAVFVVRDITAAYLAIKHTQTFLLVLMVVSLSLVIVAFMVFINRFVFRRLQHIMEIATRVVGGDFESEIKITSDDEVGQLEQLFEQFRRVFVDLLKHIPELQEK